MKMLSLTVHVREEDDIRSKLLTEKGISIFREKEFYQSVTGLGKQVSHVMFILHIHSPEAETHLRIKYPYKFEDLSV